jgi:hypothetical protein
MKPFTTCVILAGLFLQTVKGQDSVQSKRAETGHRIYKIGLILPGGQHLRAWLMAIKDSSVYLYIKPTGSPDPFHKDARRMKYDSTWDRYKFNYVESIKVNNRKLRTWAIVSGGIIGMTAGIIVGSHSGNGSGLEGATSDFMGGLLGALIGGAVGSLSGLVVASSLEKKYMINGEWKNLEELKATLKY